MVKIKSETLKKYYGEEAYDYDIRFIHYNIEINKKSKEELLLLEEDLNQIYSYANENFKIYFSNLDSLRFVKENSSIIDLYKKNIYVRIRNNKEYEIFYKLNSKLKLLIDSKDIKTILLNDEEIVLQIDKINELSLEELDNLKTKYNITSISLGQIPYIDGEYSYLLDKKYTNYNSQLEFEKGICLTNDIYDINSYKNIVLAFHNLLKEYKTENRINTFVNLFHHIANTVNYDEDAIKTTKSESQNLIGPLFNKKSVCEGYSKVIYQICNLLNIDCIVVGGGGSKEDDGHIWNQICIDGIWYNADVTIQSYAVHNNEDWNMCLVSDKWLRYKASSDFAKKCNNDFLNRQNIAKTSMKH